ncbi:MAG: hypothetical protein CMM70_01300 [Rhodospirillaceae bacterium]|nr:hypothetical protein [Rhodospirillaceae bacterium]
MPTAAYLKLTIIQQVRYDAGELLAAHFPTGVILCTQRSPNDGSRFALSEVDKTGDDRTDRLMELLKAPGRSISPFLDSGMLPIVDAKRDLEQTLEEVALLAMIKDHPIPDPMVLSTITHGTSLGMSFRY